MTKNRFFSITKKLSKLKLVTFNLALILGLTACATDEFGNRRSFTDAEKGAMIGAAAGALLGYKTADNKKKGLILGAVGGGIAGGLVGNYMDNQKRDLEKALANERSAGQVEVTKSPDHVVKVTMTSQTAFDTNSTNIKSGFKPSMNKIAKIVNKYGKTVIVIVGHTDSTGSEAYNQRLSMQRASSVHQYLSSRNVIPQRLESYGRGESQPRANNSNASGRQLNRRVEVFIEPVVSQ